MVTRQITLIFLVAVAELSCQGSFDVNLARHGKATQSSVRNKGVPERAIDGNQNGILNGSSCSQTHNESSPWWRVDLLNSKKIELVVITNRRDCCDERLNGAEIHIGNSLADNGNSNPRCAIIRRLKPTDATKVYRCFGMQGRYVNIVIPGRHEILTLCEVEVYGRDPINGFNGQNLAQFAEVTQSLPYGVAEKVIDGCRESCTQIQQELTPWTADLHKVYKVQYVMVTIRGELEHKREQLQLNGVEIRIGNSQSGSNPGCALNATIYAGTSKVFYCNLMEGQFVTIVIPDKRDILTLCEVEIYGRDPERKDLSDN